MNRALSLATAGALLLVGCSNGSKATTPPFDTPNPTRDPSGASGPSTGGFGSSRLVFFEDCPDLLSYLRTQALERVTPWGLDGGPYYYFGEGDVAVAP